MSFGAAAAGALALVVSAKTNPFAAWLAAINLSALATFRYDKAVAGTGRTRVPELVLLLLEAAGGTVGAAAAIWLVRPRHKSRSAGFLAWFLAIAALQIAALLFWAKS